jgi:hypothetical protein
MGDERVQGEGNYDAARRYRRETEQFVESGRVDEAAQAAVPTSDDEAAELEQAERAGKERAAEEDPLLRKGGQGAAR